MSAKDRIRLLQGEIARTLRAMDEAEANHHRFREDFPPVRKAPRNVVGLGIGLKKSMMLSTPKPSRI